MPATLSRKSLNQFVNIPLHPNLKNIDGNIICILRCCANFFSLPTVAALHLYWLDFDLLYGHVRQTSRRRTRSRKLLLEFAFSCSARPFSRTRRLSGIRGCRWPVYLTLNAMLRYYRPLSCHWLRPFLHEKLSLTTKNTLPYQQYVLCGFWLGCAKMNDLRRSHLLLPLWIIDKTSLQSALYLSKLLTIWGISETANLLSRTTIFPPGQISLTSQWSLSASHNLWTDSLTLSISHSVVDLNENENLRSSYETKSSNWLVFCVMRFAAFHFMNYAFCGSLALSIEFKSAAGGESAESEKRCAVDVGLVM